MYLFRSDILVTNDLDMVYWKGSAPFQPAASLSHKSLSLLSSVLLKLSIVEAASK